MKLAAGLSVLMLIAACSRTTSASAERAQGQQQTAAGTRKAAPDFTLQDANGTPVKLTDYKGKVVLLNFWATWCGPCAMEIPWFMEFQQKYKSQGFEVLGVSMDDEGWKVVKPYVSEHRINYRVVLGNDSVSQLYGGVDSLPTSFLIDQQGRVAFVHVGLAGKNEYADEIQNLIGRQNNNGSQAAAFHPIAGSLFVRSAK